MPLRSRRGVLRGVLHDLVHTFSSRNADLDGYWLLPQLTPVPELAFDLLHPGAHSNRADAYAGWLLRIHFRRLLRRSRFDPEALRTARVRLRRAPPSTGQPGLCQLLIGAEATLADGRAVAVDTTPHVSPHDPASESRSARVLLVAGVDARTGRAHLVLHAAEPARLELRDVPACRFVALLAGDARGVSADVLSAAAHRLLQHGCLWICAFGSDCERVHDIVDEVIAYEDAKGGPDWSHVMTTWHAEESLDEVVGFAKCSAFPADGDAADADAIVAIAFGADAALAERLFAALQADGS